MAEDVIVLDTGQLPCHISSGFRVFEAGKRHVNRRLDICVLVFVLEGKLYFSEDGSSHELAAGQWYLERAGRLFEGDRAGPAVRFFFVHFTRLEAAFDPAGFQLLDAGSYNTPPLGRIHLPLTGSFDAAVFLPLFNRLEQVRQTTPNHFLLLQSVFLELLSALADTVYPAVEPERQLAKQVMDFLSVHYPSDIRISDLADQFHFSADYLSRLMRRHSGVSPKAYLQQLRLRQAMDLLHHTDSPIEEIAAACGYRDPSAFFRAFKQATGESPARWRHSHRLLAPLTDQ